MPADSPLDLSLWLLGGGAVLAIGLGARWAIRQIMRPARFLQQAIRALAEGKTADAAGLRAVSGPWRGAASELARAAERGAALDGQLHDETRNLRTILESLTEGVLIVDTNQSIRSANGRLQRMFELRTPPLGRSVLEVFRNADVRDAVVRAISGETTTRQVTLDTRGTDGRYTPKHFDLTAVGLLPPDQPKPVGAILVLHDITELKSLEAVRREFVANVSHELRTPLAIINGYVETLRDEEALNDRALVQQALSVMQKHGQRLNFLIEDLLTISRFEHGRGGLEMAPVVFADAVDRVVERLEPTIAEKHARIVRTFAPNLSPLLADPNRLDQVLFNLLENALKYGPPEGLCIEIQARPRQKAAEIIIRDNGPGIPQSDLPHIFERFYRVHKDRSRDAGGTGLGLSIVKHLAHAHGGNVSVESAFGHGASFRLEWPIADDKVTA